MVMRSGLKIAISLMLGATIMLVLLIAGNSDLLTVLAVYIAMLLLSIVAYRSPNKSFTNNLVGLSKKNLGRSILWAGLLGGGFFLATKLIPGFSIGTIRLPQAIGETIQAFVIIGFAPVVETVFQVVMFAWFRTFTSVRWALFGQAGLFSAAHVSAYVSGFYNYPEFAQGLQAVNANLGSFVAAFVFAYVGMLFLIRPKIKNMAFLIIFHAILNLVILTSLSVIFL